MNWKKHAYLFTNGMFRGFCTEERKTSWAITGHNRRVGSGITYMELEDEYCFPIKTPVDTLQLVARKIEDMTDEEKEEFLQRGEHHNDDIIFESVHADFMSTTAFLYILSIGVYPFDQSDFENGTVIDINTL